MTLTPLITAEEIYPALERVVASAETEVLLAFRVLQPGTKLRAPELRDSGLDNWADLLAWTGRRGVRLRLLMADFDPLFAQGLHRKAWAAASGFAAVAQGDTQILLAPHGQAAGRLWHVALAPRLRRILAALRREDPVCLTPLQRAALETKPRLRPVTLHQKFAVVDGTRSVIGGQDVDERRFDTPDHDRSPQQTWHDVSMAVGDADLGAQLTAHFARCWNAALDCGAAALTGAADRADADRHPQGRADLRLLRTLAVPCTGPARLSPAPRITDHATDLARLIGEARRHIYIETQFLRHMPLARALAQRAAQMPDLQLIVLLPMAPERVIFDDDDGWDARHGHDLQVRALSLLHDAYGDRLALIAPGQPAPPPQGVPDLHGSGPIYVHAKVMLVDDAVGVVGSANLNGRSLLWDTEASVLFRDGPTVRDLFDRLSDKWLGGGADDARQASTWTARARDNAARDVTERRGFVLPYPMGHARRFARPLPILPDALF